MPSQTTFSLLLKVEKRSFFERHCRLNIHFAIRPDSVNASTEIDLHDEKLVHSHRFVLFDRPKPPKNIQGNINFKFSVNFLH